MLFRDLKLVEPILQALQEEGYVQPTPIQQQAIPPVLAGRDLLGCAQTGTGKTAAFALPILQRLLQQSLHVKGPAPISCLILTPTRELAIQIDESFAAYGRHLRLRHAVIFGGVSQVPQVQALQRGVDILVATPGRLLDLISQGLVSLRHLKIFVLDEADRMLDMGFIHDVKRVIVQLPRQRQTLFFSATIPPEVQTLIDVLLRDPVRVEVAPVSSTAETIDQALYLVLRDKKPDLLIELLHQYQVRSALVFTRTKHGADKVVRILHKAGVKAAAIHGNKSQNARQNALNQFKQGELQVMVATDIAARGIDIDELELVFNYDLPEVPETYVHRIGRTGRAGRSGKAIAFCDVSERDMWKDVQRLIRVNVPILTHPTLTVDPAVFAKMPVPPKPEKPARPPRRDRMPHAGPPPTRTHGKSRGR